MLRRIFPNEYVVIALVSALALMALATGCQKQGSWQDPGPDDTFERFLIDWYQGNDEAAFAAIVPEDREVLTRPLDKLRDHLEKSNLPAESEMLVAGRVDNPYDIKKIEVVEPLESAPDAGAIVKLDLIYHDGREGEATMMWGGERWFVDLPLPSQTSREQQAGEQQTGEQQAGEQQTGEQQAGEPAQPAANDQEEDPENVEDAGSSADSADAATPEPGVPGSQVGEQ